MVSPVRENVYCCFHSPMDRVVRFHLESERRDFSQKFAVIANEGVELSEGLLGRNWKVVRKTDGRSVDCSIREGPNSCPPQFL